MEGLDGLEKDLAGPAEAVEAGEDVVARLA